MEIRRLVRVDPSSPLPVYAQIEAQLESLILAGRFGRGERVPSVRELAVGLRVNPLTVSKAYGRLAGRGLVVAVRGKGIFVAEKAPRRAERRREDIIGEKIERLLDEARVLGATEEEVGEMVRKRLKL